MYKRRWANECTRRAGKRGKSFEKLRGPLSFRLLPTFHSLFLSRCSALWVAHWCTLRAIACPWDRATLRHFPCSHTRFFLSTLFDRLFHSLSPFRLLHSLALQPVNIFCATGTHGYACRLRSMHILAAMLCYRVHLREFTYIVFYSHVLPTDVTPKLEIKFCEGVNSEKCDGNREFEIRSKTRDSHSSQS